MKKQKGQDLIEYAFLLALIVAVGAGIYSTGMPHSISNVFVQAGSLLGEASKKQLSAVSSYDDIIKRLGEGRYQGLADILKETPDGQAVDIDSDSAAGQQLAQKLNIQTKDGDGWFARVNTNGYFIVSYYSADANKGVTFSQLKSDYKDNPGKYGKDPVTSRYKTTFKINEGYYYPNGNLKTYNTVGHIETSPNGSGMSIYPGAR